MLPPGCRLASRPGRRLCNSVTRSWQGRAAPRCPRHICNATEWIESTFAGRAKWYDNETAANNRNSFRRGVWWNLNDSQLLNCTRYGKKLPTSRLPTWQLQL